MAPVARACIQLPYSDSASSSSAGKIAVEQSKANGRRRRYTRWSGGTCAMGLLLLYPDACGNGQTTRSQNLSRRRVQRPDHYRRRAATSRAEIAPAQQTVTVLQGDLMRA